MNGNPNTVANRLGPAQGVATFGWLGPVLTVMGNGRRWAHSLTDANTILVDQAYPLLTIHKSPEELLSACRLAVQGSGTKFYLNGIMPAAGADLNLDLTAVRSFGVRVRISDSPTAFKFGSLLVELRDAAVVLARIVIQTNRLPADLVMFGISNVTGQASVIPIVNPRVFIPGSANATPNSTVSSSTFVFAETLNARDIGQISRD